MSKWTEEEIGILRGEYSKETVDLKRLSALFLRDKSNISRKARELGFGTSYRRPKSESGKASMRRSRGGLAPFEDAWLKENFNNFTNRRLAEMLGHDERFIEKQLRRLRLKRDVKARGWFWPNGHPKGFLGKIHRPESLDKMSRASKKMWQNPGSPLNSPEHRQRLSDRASLLNASPSVRRSRFSRCRSGSRADLGGLYLRSEWEANYARYLSWMKSRGEIREWEYEPKTFWFTEIKRGTRSYTPDFRVIEKGGEAVFHEVKGWMDQKSRTRLDRMARYYPEEKIVLIGAVEYKAISKWRSLIPNWEGK